VIFVRLEKSIDPVELVHRLCAEAQANPETKKSRYVKRMTPVTEVRKTLSVDLEAFAREILKPHFHSGGPPKKVSDNDYPASDLVPLWQDFPSLHIEAA
jgi:tRNA acetyltransferase TAN1